MIFSMTGYGRAVKMFDNREITVEVRSVNNRYLDCTVKMPRSFIYMEEQVKKAVKESISRGKVDVFISLRNSDGNDTKITLNKGVAESYISALRQMTEDYGLVNDLSVSAMANLPDLFTHEQAEIDEEQSAREIMEVVSMALNQHRTMREIEGRAMTADLRARAVTILQIVSEVEKRSAVTVAEYRKRLYEKMSEVLSSTQIDESRILAEAAIYSDKVAVDEETVRLRSHFEQMENMLATGGAIGRKLDFLVQEMNREANTTGSKGNDIEQARNVVAIKAELEKIREQIQNIE